MLRTAPAALYISVMGVPKKIADSTILTAAVAAAAGVEARYMRNTVTMLASPGFTPEIPMLKKLST